MKSADLGVGGGKMITESQGKSSRTALKDHLHGDTA